jgi:hypothetical protein
LDILDNLSDGVREAVLNIEPPEGVDHSYRLPESILRYSRNLQEAADVIAASMAILHEANAIVLEWRDRLAALQPARESKPVHTRLR